MINICSDDLLKSKEFYTTLFRLELNFDSDWFIQLSSENPKVELGIIDSGNQLVPQQLKRQVGGVYLTFVVDDVEPIYQTVLSSGFEVVEEPTDMPYGQRRLLLKDPNGTFIDVSAPIPDFKFE